MVVMYRSFAVVVDGEVHGLLLCYTVQIYLSLKFEVGLFYLRQLHIQFLHSVIYGSVLHIDERRQIIHCKLLIPVLHVLVHEEVEEHLLCFRLLEVVILFHEFDSFGSFERCGVVGEEGQYIVEVAILSVHYTSYHQQFVLAKSLTVELFEQRFARFGILPFGT